MQLSDLVALLQQFTDGAEQRRQFRHLLETNPDVREIAGHLMPTKRGSKGNRTEPAYVGDGRNMRQGSQGKSRGPALRAGVFGRVELVYSDLSKLDFTHGITTGVFLPDPPPPACGVLLELMACG